MSDAWFKFYSSDWLSGCAMLTPAERGIYITLIAAMYDAGGAIANETRRLARLTGASNSSLKKTIEALINDGKLELDEHGYLTNSRVKSELRDRVLRQEKARVAGEKSQQKQNPTKNQAEHDASYTRKPESQKVEPYGSTEKRARKRAERLPENWILPSEWIEDATSRGLSVEQAYDQAERMRDWSRSAPASKGAKLDWRAAWRNWIKRVCDDRGKPSGGGGGGNYADRQRAAADTAQSAAVRVAQRRMGWSDDHSARSSAHDGEPHLRVIDASDTGHGFGADRASGQALSATAAKRAGGGNVF